MKFQAKGNRVQCYRVDVGGKTMVTSIKLGVPRNDIDMQDERNSQLTIEELEAYERWFERYNQRKRAKSDARWAEYEKTSSERLEADLRGILSNKKDLTDEQKDLLVECGVDILKTLKPELLEPKITLRTYLKSLFS